MIERMFDSPVFVRAAKDFIQPINSVDDALEFLYEWPEDKRSTNYAAAVEACQRAFEKTIPLKAAKNAFIRFAHAKDILEEVSTAIPWLTTTPVRGGVPV